MPDRSDRPPTPEGTTQETRRASRPTKFTPDRQKVILDALRSGLTRQAAAGLAGIHRSLMTVWCARYSTFATECDVAEQVAEARFSTVVVNAAYNGDVKTALEWLKRRRPQEWSERFLLQLSQMEPDEVTEYILAGHGALPAGAPGSPGADTDSTGDRQASG